MIATLRRQFNEQITPERYERMKQSLYQEAGCQIPFRLAETPLFIPREFMRRASTLAEEILERSASPELQKIGAGAVPTDFSYASETARPMFGAVDFAITGTPENPGLKLIELQGFPSLFHFQAAYSQVARHAYDLPSALTGLAYPESGYENYYGTLKELIVGNHDPSEVVLLELGPYNQKTLADFILAHKQLGIAIVDIGDVEANGDELTYRDESGKRHRISRIYNRSIHDEIVAKGARVPFDITKPYHVEWAGHPNWFFKISKVLLPHLSGLNEAVPNAMLLSDAKPSELDLSQYVLKPLYSFAGAGVVVGPTLEDIDSISHYAYHHWLLQERVYYADAIVSPNGDPIKAELRILLGWPESEASPRAMHTLVRLTRGMKVGVDQNSGLDWVGASCGLIPLE